MKRFLNFLRSVLVGVVQAPFVLLWIVLHVALNIAVTFVVCSPILLLMGLIELIQLIIKDPINWVEKKTGLKIR